MSVVTVQLGQCGNQIGPELFSTVYEDSTGAGRKTYQESSRERFFWETSDGVLVARSVLVDMEPKVISQAVAKASKSGKWRYGEKAHFCQKQGSGNNWANGYCVHGPRHKESVEDLVRREVERCDRLAGIFAMMSVAGGTGSGVGTFVTQCLRDMYPQAFILNHLTWPYGTGEVIVQNYNSVLTLSRLYQLSDALVVHENDTVHKICSRLMNIKHISIGDINKVIAHQLGSVLQPAYTGDSPSNYSRNPIGELLSSLVCHPEYKLLSLCNIPQMSHTSLAYSAYTWPGLLKHLRQMLIANARMEEGIDWKVCVPSSRGDSVRTGQMGFNRSLANLMILRGKDVSSADAGAFKDPALYVPWLPPDGTFSLWNSPVPFNGYEKSASLVSNSQSLLKPLDNMVRKAWNMFVSRAYMHQYTKFGISEDDFLDSFTTLEQIISSYSHL
ncbi:tubulin delta chain isoform X1 [Astyanax mexicanus]|uniref:Tubulin delta chain n=3 Tax=Astyanax mexicanus TaxID=7994 RepID=W5K3C0_ASTMX|nr:tubulin delta chain isoform X1 [Astyanax mexicanus]XP_022530072.1 tubulin delta chain isoform X1 [Astyanax mexicanus]